MLVFRKILRTYQMNDPLVAYFVKYLASRCIKLKTTRYINFHILV